MITVAHPDKIKTGQVSGSQGNRLFPIFLKLENLDTLIIGGGLVGYEKLKALLSNSPKSKVTLVAPLIRKEIYSLARQYPNVILIKREFHINDFDNKDMVISATNNRVLNSFIRYVANKKKVLLNTADMPELCDFYLGAVVQKGSIKMAISTNGKSPTIAKRLREIISSSIPDQMESVLDNLVKIRNSLNGSFSEKVKTLNSITSVLVEDLSDNRKPAYRLKVRLIRYSLIMLAILGIMLTGYIFFQFIFSLIDINSVKTFMLEFFSSADEKLPWYLLAGFIAQMIDGVLGMAYGISATSFLLVLGIPPATASSGVHISEIFTCGASGLFHLKLGNVNKRLFKNLLLPGIIGAIAGAYVLTSLSHYGFIIKPLIAAYTLILGIAILCKAFKKKRTVKKIRNVTTLAGFGGFFDSVGGGGWGPIVSSTLIAKGNHPVVTIGSVNLAEFFVALASSAAFITFIGLSHWQLTAGLIVGGIIASPIAAKTARKLPVKTLMILVGLLIIVLSFKIIYTTMV